MKLRSLLVVLVSFAGLAPGCGYFMAGSWEDDPQNWERAFRSTKPEDVVVRHSWYWRSPHWSYEFQYFFELAPSTELTEQLFTANELRQVTGDEALEVHRNVRGEVPAWFAPKSAAEYDIWVFGREPERNFKVLIDRRTGEMFLNDHQM